MIVKVKVVKVCSSRILKTLWEGGGQDSGDVLCLRAARQG